MLFCFVYEVHYEPLLDSSGGEEVDDYFERANSDQSDDDEEVEQQQSTVATGQTTVSISLKFHSIFLLVRLIAFFHSFFSKNKCGYRGFQKKALTILFHMFTYLKMHC